MGIAHESACFQTYEYSHVSKQSAVTSALGRYLGRYDLCSSSSHIPLQQTAILLGSSPPKLLCKHDKAWTDCTCARSTQLTAPALDAHNSSTHSNLTSPDTNPQPLPDPHSPSPPPLPAPPLMIHSAMCVKVPLTRKTCLSVTYLTPICPALELVCDISNAGCQCHMDCLLPPLTTVPAGIWKCPLCTPPAPSPQGTLRHLRFPSPILDPDSD